MPSNTNYPPWAWLWPSWDEPEQGPYTLDVEVAVEPPYGVATYLTPTSLRLSISETQGDPVQVFWRALPHETRDRWGPRLTGGDGAVDVQHLPVSASILFNIFREVGNAASRPYAFPASNVRGDTLAGALGRKWALVPALTQLCGPLFSQEAPQSLLGRRISLPWTILHYDHSSYDWTFEGLYYETTQADLTVYALGHQQVEDALAAMHSALDWQSLPFESYPATRVVKVEPTDYLTANTFARHRSGEVVWHGKLSYLVTVEKSHPRWPPFQHLLNN